MTPEQRAELIVGTWREKLPPVPETEGQYYVGSIDLVALRSQVAQQFSQIAAEERLRHEQSSRAA